MTEPWPWYVAGPLIGLMVPLLLLLAGRDFGVSSSLEHICAAGLPKWTDSLRYDWRRKGLWNLAFVAGIFLGGVIAGRFLANPEPVAISDSTRAVLAAMGIRDFSGLVPSDLIGWSSLLTLRGFTAIVVGGFLVGFGARWAGGCTSGHAITGLATLQVASLLAVAGFFAGGLFVAWIVLPWLL